ncbi:peptide ABC transporter permease [Actinoplanes sp. SE50]|uniref:ABC transporter permease n=1 Tax=unclassified Actinoplanes TaxID=2626549 RepID=UPI00023EE08E|nr:MULTISPECIES: ABC transporter permease [unclassified Actinoplanes]AEV89009.1 peptide/nickel transport system permease protein [Actinoplanes sp. SE50/110]ATO87415.1 peptide ABC transporter permease [Actinoplanes sp. SE50]SLM04833.1 ABC-type peptide/nickel transporter, permease component [Actinoplanes sp. SE50/110]
MSLGPEASISDDAPPPPAVDAAETRGPAEKAIVGRSLKQIAWRRLKRDKVAVAGGVFVLFLIAVAFLAPLLAKWFGHPFDEFHGDQVDQTFQTPLKPWGGISKDFILGVEPVNGRDVFSRIVYGAQTSLSVAFLAAFFSTILGSVFGLAAGYLGGWVDSVISRVMDFLLAFPQLLFAIALVSVLPQSFLGFGNRWSRVLVLVLVIGFFGWPYVGRIVRGQTLSLREREFVEAARSIGARSPRILFRELLPNLAAPILVYTTLIIPTNILTEAALSFLGVGIPPPNPSWGGMLSDALPFYADDPLFMIIPGGMIFITVLAFNLFGDGLRDALDPKAR